MKPRTYPTSIAGAELNFIEEYLLNGRGHLKAAAISAIPEPLKTHLRSIAKSRGLEDTSDITECIFWIKHDLTDYPKLCCTCNGKIKTYHSFSRGYPHKRCSTKCSNSDASVKILKTEASMDKYGTEFPWQNKEVKNRSRVTFLNTWFDKRFTQFLPEYEPVTSREDYLGTRHKETHKQHKFKWRHTVCGYVFDETLINGVIKPMCPACRDNLRLSRPQRDIIDFVKSLYSGVIVTNDRRTIWPLELDIYIPEKKIAIEYHGLYWHSYNKLETKEEKNKHKVKADICEERGIRLIQMFEHEWNEKQDIVKARLKTMLGYNERIFARKCIVEQIDNAEALPFQRETHLQGSCPASVKLGLRYSGKLVALMTFGVPRFSKKYEWELIRYCSIGTIVGGASKLLSHFKSLYNPQSIVTYADRRWSSGNMYFKLGFRSIDKSSPNYFYYKGSERKPRYAFQKHKMHKILENFDLEKTEYENAFMNDYRRVWDAGNHVMVWTPE